MRVSLPPSGACQRPQMPLKKSDLYASLWASCDALRGADFTLEGREIDVATADLARMNMILHH